MTETHDRPLGLRSRTVDSAALCRSGLCVRPRLPVRVLLASYRGFDKFWSFSESSFFSRDGLKGE